MKKFLLTAVPPILGIIISTQGGLIVNEVHAEKFDPSDTYVVEILDPIKTHNRLNILNKNQTILNINKKDKAVDIIKKLNLQSVDKDKYVKMLDTAINEYEINNIVESALKSSEKNEGKATVKDNKKKDVAEEKEDTEDSKEDSKEESNENKELNISTESDADFVYYSESLSTPPIEYNAPVYKENPAKQEPINNTDTSPSNQKEASSNITDTDNVVSESVENNQPTSNQNTFEIVEDVSVGDSVEDSVENFVEDSVEGPVDGFVDNQTRTYVSPEFEIVDTSETEVTSIVDSAHKIEETVEEPTIEVTVE